ncbi:MAG TPA: hypothetical protein VHN80_31995 [Kineosporiaceae bacterium]|nr:hypothetical protein [Kineosporiaceae bacterium]
MSGQTPRGRDRQHLAPARRRQLFVRCTEEEYADIAAAASAAGLSVGTLGSAFTPRNVPVASSASRTSVNAR